MLRMLTAPALAVLLLPALYAADPPKGDKDLDGEWEQQSMVRDGKDIPPMKDKPLFSVKGETASLTMGGSTQKGTLKVDVSKTPKTIDLTPDEGPEKDAPMKGVYAVKGDELRICFGDAGKDRPLDLSSKEGSRSMLLTFKRVKK